MKWNNYFYNYSCWLLKHQYTSNKVLVELLNSAWKQWWYCGSASDYFCNFCSLYNFSQGTPTTKSFLACTNVCNTWTHPRKDCPKGFIVNPILTIIVLQFTLLLSLALRVFDSVYIHTGRTIWDMEPFRTTKILKRKHKAKRSCKTELVIKDGIISRYLWLRKIAPWKESKTSLTGTDFATKC